MHRSRSKGKRRAGVEPSKLALAVGCLLALLGLIGAVGGWAAYLTDSRLLASGPRAVGTVVRKQFLPAADGSSDYLIEYHFNVPIGQQLQSLRGVSKDLWSSLSVGATLPVVYAAADPQRNFPVGAGVTSWGATVFVSAVFFVVALFGVVLVRAQLRRPASAA